METFELPEPARVNYLNAEYGLKSWLLTRDHKRIALLYLGSISFFFFIGGIYAMLIRLELLTPQGDLLQSTTYNKVFTQHGIIMVFFFLIPSIPATLGNFLVPMMIGAKDLAFPRINLLSWYHLHAGRDYHNLRAAGRRCRYRLDVLRSLQHDLFQFLRGSHRRWHLYQWLLIDSDRPQFHRHDSHNARSRHDMVSAATVYLVHLRDQPGHDSGNARYCHHNSSAGV